MSPYQICNRHSNLDLLRLVRGCGSSRDPLQSTHASLLGHWVISDTPIHRVDTCPTTLTANCSSCPSMAITDSLVLKPPQGDCLSHALPRRLSWPIDPDTRIPGFLDTCPTRK